MTDSEKLLVLKTMTDEVDEVLLNTYLSIGAHKVCRRAYPFDLTQTVVPAQYEMNQIEIAAYLINKRGAEGELSHSENGISRSYSDGDVPASMLREIVPMCAVIGGGQ